MSLSRPPDPATSSQVSASSTSSLLTCASSRSHMPGHAVVFSDSVRSRIGGSVMARVILRRLRFRCKLAGFLSYRQLCQHEPWLDWRLGPTVEVGVSNGRVMQGLLREPACRVLVDDD